MTAPSSSAGTVVREATPADLPDVVRLLSARDEQPRDPQVVGTYLWGLDPEHTCTWLAFVGDRAVGITMLYLRDMVWPHQESVEFTTQRAGYWSHLYVEPEFRRQMVYPQLVLAMIRGMAAHGISLIYTATRQPQVAEGHQKLGFALVGTLPLRLRPLRPFRLLAKHKGIKPLAPLSGPLDALAGLFIRRRKSSAVTIDEISLTDPRVEEIVALMNSRTDGKVRQMWTAEQFRRRFAITLDGTNYRIVVVNRDGSIVAALVTVIIERGNSISAGVVVTLMAKPTATAQEVATLLADAEEFAYRHQAELMLSLDESLNLPQLANVGGKYLSAGSESYHLLVYPKKLAKAPYPAAELKNWCFDYADHDAF
jgi:GNAT superfamily N-acetyltransferase